MSKDVGEIDYDEKEYLKFGAEYYPKLGDTAEIHLIDKGLIEELDEDVSSINTIVINEECNGSIYNLNGSKVDGNNLVKGIYIKNGKKVIIK